MDVGEVAARRALDHVTRVAPGADLASRAIAHLGRWQQQVDRRPSLGPSRLTLNFHPDRPTHGGGTVLESVLTLGTWHNQFETATTNGFAVWEKDAIRVRREAVLFGGAYDHAAPSERPKYAGLNAFGNTRGAWPRFGSCHWVLADEILDRSTCTIPGSHASRAWWAAGDGLSTLTSLLGSVEAPAAPHRFPRIDGAVEVQVHGQISLGRDVTALVLDPSFRGTPTETAADLVASAYDVRIEWAPALSSSAADWKFASTHARASGLVSDARATGRRITAAWIGLDCASNPDEALRLGSPVDVTSRYLWNRLLLTSDQSFGS